MIDASSNYEEARTKYKLWQAEYQAVRTLAGRVGYLFCFLSYEMKNGYWIGRPDRVERVESLFGHDIACLTMTSFLGSCPFT